MGIYDYNAVTLDGEERSLADFKGKVLLIVNTASKCGFTPQYKGLQALYQRYKDRGLVVLGFPCNQFGHQEPGDEVEIGAFCEKNYGVDFPMFAKIDVNGSDAHPLYRYLKSEAPACSAAKASNGTSPNSWSTKAAVWYVATPPRINRKRWQRTLRRP